MVFKKISEFKCTDKYELKQEVVSGLIMLLLRNFKMKSQGKIVSGVLVPYIIVSVSATGGNLRIRTIIT